MLRNAPGNNEFLNKVARRIRRKSENQIYMYPRTPLNRALNAGFGNTMKPRMRTQMKPKMGMRMVNRGETQLPGDFEYGFYPYPAPNMALGNALGSMGFGNLRETQLPGDFEYGFYPYPAPNMALGDALGSMGFGNRRQTRLPGDFEYGFYPYPAPNMALGDALGSMGFGKKQKGTRRKTKSKKDTRGTKKTHTGFGLNKYNRVIKVYKVGNQKQLLTYNGRKFNGKVYKNRTMASKARKKAVGKSYPPTKKTERRKMLKKCGSKCFLDPKGLRYPVCNRDCRVSLDNIQNAYMRASQHHDRTYINKAKKLRKRYQ